MTNHSRAIVELEEITNSCFVVMPFKPAFDLEYEKVIRPAIQNAGLDCVRGDEIYNRQTIVEDIWCSIRKARIVVAELSERNANVMYEIGLAHAIGKPIVLITRNQDDVPFDLRALRYVFYDLNVPDWGTYLRERLTDILKLIIENPTLGVHLAGVRVETKLPDAPVAPIVSDILPHTVPDLSGAWLGTWISIHLQLKHEATLVIPKDHGSSFTASMTVSFERGGRQSIIEETFTANLEVKTLTLRGVSYTYVQQGGSRSYSLDSFVLELSGDGLALVGKAALQNGERSISFKRLR